MRSRFVRLSAVLLAVVCVGAAASAGAAVTLTATRAEALYAADGDPDCSKLSKLPDDQLPMHVVRLRATAAGSASGQVRYLWSVPHPQVGTLVADLDLGPSDETGAIRALCAEFGNACVLTPDKLPFYNQPTILWVGPTCASLPDRASRPFTGGQVFLGVTVTQGGRRLGKAATKVGFGRAAEVTLYVNGRDGVGQPGGVPSSIDPLLGAVVNPKSLTLPAGTFEFDNGAGGQASLGPVCGFGLRGDPHRYDSCVAGLLYHAAGKFTASVKEKFDDGSALCDNADVHVLSANIIPRLSVTATPSRLYVPGDPVRGGAVLQVTLHNDSPRVGGSGILLTGAGILSCNSKVKVGGTKDSRQTSFDLQHCSVTTTQPCRADADCQAPFCADCNANETCLRGPHCSTTTAQACAGDADCKSASCPTCEDDEHCVHLLSPRFRCLETPRQPCVTDADCQAPRCPTCAAGDACPLFDGTSITLEIGQEVDLVYSASTVQNLFPDPAKIVDDWTVTTFNAGTADASIRYVIRPNKTAP